MPDTITMPDPRDWAYLAPVILLTAWGLAALLADVALLRRAPSSRRRAWLGGFSLLGTLAAAGSCVLSFLGWHRDDALQADLSLFGGTIAGDAATVGLSLVLALLLALVVLLAASWDFTEHWGEFYALLLWVGASMMLLVAAEELLILFLALETMTIGLYLLTALEKRRRRSAEAGLKYFVYGSVSSALFLYGLSLLYGLTSSTRLAAIRVALSSGTQAGGMDGDWAGATAMAFILVGLGFKLAAAPFHQWAPDAYEGAPAPVSAWIAAGSKLASVVAMIKILRIGLAPWGSGSTGLDAPVWLGIVAIVAAVSMTLGNLAALPQRNFKRLLAYSSIAHAGYILVGVVGLSIGNRAGEATAGILYYVVTYAFASVGTFALAAWLARDLGTDEVDDLNGMAGRSPVLAACVSALLISLIGLPPFAGFFGKLWMFLGALRAAGAGNSPMTWLVVLALVNTVISAFYYARILRAMYLRPATAGRELSEAPTGIRWSIVAPTTVVLGFGLAPSALYEPLRAISFPLITPGVARPLSPSLEATTEPELRRPLTIGSEAEPTPRG